MSKNSSNLSTLCRRAAALLATLALLAAMTLPVYAEAVTEDPTLTTETVETSDVPENVPETVEDASANTETNDTTDTASAEPADDSDNTADDDADDTTLSVDDPDAAPNTPAGETPDEDIVETPDENNDAVDDAANGELSETTATKGETTDDVALYDDIKEAYFDIYFALPKDWNNAQKIYFQGMRGNQSADGYSPKREMTRVTDTDKTTADGKKIYKVNLHYKQGDTNQDIDCSYGGFAKITFTKDNDTTGVDAKLSYDGNSTTQFWQKYETLKDHYYDSDTQQWIDISELKPRHTHLAGQKFTFKNMTGNDLANVQAVFYDKAEDATELTQVKTVNLGSVQTKQSTEVTIPDDVACAYVAFFADGVRLGNCFNFCNDDSTTENVTSFLYSSSRNCFVYTKSGNVVLTEEGSRKIYYDATFSKLDAENSNHAIPITGESVYCHLWVASNPSDVQDVVMQKADDSGNLYVIDNVDAKYDRIIFSNNPVTTGSNGGGSRTGDLEIPSAETYTFPCFYADTSDDATYGSGNRDGYWAEVNTLRDAETGKSTSNNKKDVVAIQTGNFVVDPATKYVSTTLYDYYTDYELNGNSRSDYVASEGYSKRNWVTFREFDQAISDYYEAYDTNDANTNKILYPIYTGHFQPSINTWVEWFANIGDSLGLYGWASSGDKYKAFISANNSAGNEGKGETDRYNYAFQGIVANTLGKNGDLLMNSGLKNSAAATTLAEPHFNEEFLLGKNSKNAKLGEVYHDVSFPFTKAQVFEDEPGVDYWWYDSSKTSLYLREDTTKDQLYLGNNKGNGKTANYLDNKSKNLDSSGKTMGENQSEVKTEYGFFPFNESMHNDYGVASQYNYGYGAKLEIPFSITEDGMVESTSNGVTKQVPIRYYFSGDDDVWVFIDNQLVLDVGGAHGKVSGILDFSQSNGANTVTAYVSNVKYNKYIVNGYGPLEANKSDAVSIKYNYDANATNYYQKTTTTIKDLTTGTHTLTMYYMERGMWESNMAIAFNFPDHNELQVEKQVDVSGVDKLFKDCFKDQKLFNFTIANQATHYGTTVAEGSGATTIDLLNDYSYTLTTGTINNGEKNVFREGSPPNDTSSNTKVLQWYAQYEDLKPSPGANKEKRYGILTLNNTTIDIRQMSYLTFDVYVDYSGGTAALSNMYLQLVDANDKKMGCLDQTFLNGALYGEVQMQNQKWITVKLDLAKLKCEDDFDLSQVKGLQFGCNYPRWIYLRNIVFSSKTTANKVTGFTTAQDAIPDYGSVANNKLMPAWNAQYTSNKEDGTMVVDENGGFVLQDKEVITFKDQFRRGSYLSINENTDSNLFSTKWTVYENDQPVTTQAGDKVSLKDDTTKTLENIQGTGPDDGRIEKQYAEGDTAQSGNRYDGQKPNANTLVFRSYVHPDASDAEGLTKLRVQFTNTVKTGSLSVTKKADKNGEPLGNKKYKFTVRFTNVGGHALESEAIEQTFELAAGETWSLSGIPVGTRFTIKEEETGDDSKLMDVSFTGGGADMEILSDNTVRGSIAEAEKPQAEVTFTNTKQELLDITGKKVWKNADGDEITDDRPTIYVQLQRRHQGETDESKWEPVKYQDSLYLEIQDGYGDMTFSFLGVPAKDYDQGGQLYEYRVVEGRLDSNGNFVAVDGVNDKTITIGDKVYDVTYSPETVTTGTNQSVTITNRQQKPKFTLDIIKKDAENNETLLANVEFTLEKLKDDGNGNWVVDGNFATLTGVTNGQGELMLKNANGEMSDIQGFKDLDAGTYRLTETKAAENYNLLSAPILIIFDEDGKCKVGDDTPVDAKNDTNFTGDAVHGYKLALTVLNRKTPTLPHTGADAPSLWLLIGLPLAVAGLLILVFRYNKKGGRTR